MFPSIKTLQHIEGIDLQKAKIIRGLIEGTIDPYTFSDVRKWTKQCYNPPSKMELIMCACNEVIDGYGVEYTPKGHNAKSPSIEYVNMGDSYNTTLCLLDGHQFRVCCWGDIVERGNYD